MTHRRNILTVDGEQVAIVDRRGVVWNYQKQELKHKFSKQFGIGYNGLGCVYQEPVKEIKLWRPEQN